MKRSTEFAVQLVVMVLVLLLSLPAWGYAHRFMAWMDSVLPGGGR